MQTAFERLRKFGLAKPVEGTEGPYDVFYKGFRNDVRQHFCELEARVKELNGPIEVKPGLLHDAAEADAAAAAESNAVGATITASAKKGSRKGSRGESRKRTAKKRQQKRTTDGVG